MRYVLNSKRPLRDKSRYNVIVSDSFGNIGETLSGLDWNFNMIFYTYLSNSCRMQTTIIINLQKLILRNDFLPFIIKGKEN